MHRIRLLMALFLMAASFPVPAAQQKAKPPA